MLDSSLEKTSEEYSANATVERVYYWEQNVWAYKECQYLSDIFLVTSFVIFSIQITENNKT